MACIPSFLLYPGKSQVCILYICQNLHMFPEDSSLKKKGKKHVTKYICKLQAHTRNDDAFSKTTTLNYHVRYLSWLIGFRNNEQVICGKQRILSRWKVCNRFFFYFINSERQCSGDEGSLKNHVFVSAYTPFRWIMIN